MSQIPKYILNCRNGEGGGGLNPASLKTVGYDTLIKDPQNPVGNVEFGYQQQSQVDPGGYLYVGQQRVALRTVNGEPLVGNTDIQITGEANMVSIHWNDLVSLRREGQLVPGTWYRIFDYECTTEQPYTSSAGHVFDIIVLALDTETLSEDAFATHHEGDTYFSDSKLEAWRLKYCLDNDTDRFYWSADKSPGKGVVYWMRDEFGNEAPYDFKNILFNRYAINGTTSSVIGKDGMNKLDDVLIYDNEKNPFCFGISDTDYTCGQVTIGISDKIAPQPMYTFGGLTDLSLAGDTNGCYGNVIKPWLDSGIQKLNNGVWILTTGSTKFDHHHTTRCSYNCHDWTCLDDNNNWSCGDECSGWICLGGCYDWSCGDKCDSWIAGIDCFCWSCGNECRDWVCICGCTNWSCGEGSSEWVCYNDCVGWSCGNKCQQWICGESCGEWSCGNNCSCWSVGDWHGGWSCGNSCSYWQSQNVGTSSAPYRYFHLLPGTRGSSQSIIDISDLLSVNIVASAYIGYDSNGVLRKVVLVELPPV